MIELNSRPVYVPRGRGKRKTSYPFEKMQVGNWFFVPRAGEVTRNYMYVAGKRHGIKLTTRVLCMRESLEGWVEDQSGVLGLMVIREG